MTLTLALCGACGAFQGRSTLDHVRTAAAVADGLAAALYREQHTVCMRLDTPYAACMARVESLAVAVIAFHDAANTDGQGAWCFAANALEGVEGLDTYGAAGKEAQLAIVYLAAYAREKCE